MPNTCGLGQFCQLDSQLAIDWNGLPTCHNVTMGYFERIGCYLHLSHSNFGLFYVEGGTFGSILVTSSDSTDPGGWYAASTIEWWVYLWQSGSALQVTGTELKIATEQL